MTAQLTTLSLEDFLVLSETKPANEYIDGKIYAKPMPQGEHSIIQSLLGNAINQVGKSEKLAIALTELRCTIDGRSLVPDISVFEWSRIPRTDEGRILNRFSITPDWVIEILSPEQSSTQVIEKMIFCLNRGTKLGWFIDTIEESVMVFQEDRLPSVFRDNSPIPVLECLGDWKISATDLFAWLCP